MRFGVQHALQKFFELLFGNGFLLLDNLVPDITLFEDFYRQVIQIDLQNPDTGLLKAIGQLTLENDFLEGALDKAGLLPSAKK